MSLKFGELTIARHETRRKGIIINIYFLNRFYYLKLIPKKYKSIFNLALGETLTTLAP